MNKSYEPKTFENEIYAKWMEKGYFTAKVNKNKKPFIIMMPPPNITGQLHIGHALNNSIQDALIRYKRMKGFEALWLPGTDHASIATEVKIVDKMKAEGLSKADLGREGFLKRAFEWNDTYGGKIFEQFKKLGLSADWSKKAFTMDEKLSKAVREVFVSLYEKGLIYQGNRIINWCPDCKTALSDAEVEHEESASSLWYIKYPIDGTDEFITVATTRPETMLGDVAVAVNPKDKRYAHLVGKFAVLPFINRLIPVIADDYVDLSFGTGVVKITPAHDPNDFEVGQRHGLEVVCVMNENGTMNNNAGKFASLERFAARKAILKELEELKLLVKTDKHKNNVAHCYRCDTIVEPMVSKQWFVKMEPLAGPAIDVVKDGSIKFLPKRFEKIYLHWMENIRDWCISRQLWWGHRIPAFYCDKCSKVHVSREDLSVCPECGAPLRQDEDVLDTWFSSALWPFSTLGYPEKTPELDYFYPTDVLVTAYDIIFFWVARMIFSGLEHTGHIPFKYVYINGLVRDELGRKMSKSLNNGIDPLEIIESHGTDPLRFSLLNGIAAGGDQRFSKEKLEGYRNFMNKIWNAARFVLMNCENAEILPIEKIKGLTLADKWILTRLSAVTAEINKSMDKFEVGQAAAKIYDFIWTEFCDWYIELSKTALYSADNSKRSKTVSVLVHVLRTSLKLAHPIIPFITEEIYQNLPGNDEESIMISAFPENIKAYKKDAAEFEKVMSLIKGIRNLRAEMNVSQSRRTAIYIDPKDESADKLLKQASAYIEKLACGSGVEFGIPTVKSAKLVTEIADIYLPMGELVDYKAEIDRLSKELETVNAEIERAEGKLNNAGFTSKAPKALLDAEKQKLEKYTELKNKLESGIEALKSEI